YYSVNTGSGWSEPAPVNEHPAVDDYPDLAVDGEGRVWCVWGSTRGGEAGIWASYTPFTGVEEEPVTHQPPTFSIDRAVGRHFNFYVPSQVIPGKLEIYDACGRLVRQLAVDNQTLFWNGTEDAGKRLSPGVYFVRFSMKTGATEKIILTR
ncbi:T9SS type A sorting domain-containing protein, partial [candidate division WOR-3 bacterium]|nr:T9SS type A sorting domain-containing protein [candidate division WOR-3 bacterium]